MPILVALFGPKRGLRLELAGSVTIGRSPEADLQLVDPKVSREHCRLLVRGDEVMLEDLGSQNGTFVNGERLEGPRAVGPADEIAVGDSLLVLDGGLELMAARFGEETVLLTSGESTVIDDRPAAALSARAAEHLRALGRALAGASSAAAATAAVLSALEAALDADRIFVITQLPDGSLRPLAGRVRGASGAPVVMSRTLLACTARERRALVWQDASGDRALRGARSVVQQGLRSVLVAPLLSGDEVVGFIHADRKGPDAFAPDAAGLLDGIAALVAVHGLGGALSPAPAPAPTDIVVGRSESFARAVRMARAAAASPSTVLITGESGTGKEEIARLLHAERGRGPFVAVNCGAIPEALVESELFGHEKGAFTGAARTQEGRVQAAEGGTLFLDEIGELPLTSQVKLLRFLQERIYFRVGSSVPRRVELRVVAATHRELEAEVRAGRFREDLFYRLNVVRIHLPPLRERPEDIVPLARALLARIAARLGRLDPGVSAGGELVLRRARWPGNARELANVLERALVLRPPGERRPLGEDELTAATGGMDLPAPSPGTTLPEKIMALERTEIIAALRRARGIKARAAEALGISRPTLDKKIAELGIDLWAEPPGEKTSS